MVRGVRLGLHESDQPVLCCPGEPPVLRMWKEKDDSLDSFLPNKATARMVETTSYALLTSLQYGSVSYCNPIVSWLSDEQQYGGGFYSTQVCLGPGAVSLHFLSLFSSSRLGTVRFSFQRPL